MKSLKIVLASLVLAVGVISLSSFVSKNYDSNAFATVCYKINPNVEIADVKINDLTAVGLFGNPTNWATQSLPITTAVCNNDVMVCVICFDDSQFTSVPPSVKTPLENALDALKAKIGGTPGLQFTHGGTEVVTFNGVSRNITTYLREEL